MKLSSKQIPVLATAAVLVLLYAAASLVYKGFFSIGVFVNFFGGTAVLGIAAIGMTFVILSGGIDLSVGAVVGFTGILVAQLIQEHHWTPLAAIAVALLAGTVFGAGMGSLIQFFSMPPFLVTLAGMFLARGLGFLLNLESVAIDHPFYKQASGYYIPIGGAEIPATAIALVLVLCAAVCTAHHTKFGRNVYAIGGNEQSAVLMGLPVARTKIIIYATCGFCAALAGVVNTFYMSAGDPTAGTGLELEAIAAVAIGGTLLSGGVGYVAGTMLGVMIFGVIQTGIMFQGTLSSWWTKIAVGLLLLAFILLQKFIQSKSSRR